VVKACARCSVSGLEQSTGKQGKEPLKTLATYRCWEQAIWFGQSLVARGEGVLNVGAAVEIISCDLDKVYTVLHICHRQKETSYRRFPHLAPHSSALYFEHHDAVISSIHSHLQEIQKALSQYVLHYDRSASLRPIPLRRDRPRAHVIRSVYN
jgi:hypothetical protein